LSCWQTAVCLDSFRRVYPHLYLYIYKKKKFKRRRRRSEPERTCWKYEICSLKDNGYGSSWIILMAHGLLNGWPNVLHIAHFVILWCNIDVKKWCKKWCHQVWPNMASMGKVWRSMAKEWIYMLSCCFYDYINPIWGIVRISSHQHLKMAWDVFLCYIKLLLLCFFFFSLIFMIMSLSIYGFM